MKARKCTITDLENALIQVNKKYDGNVCFKNIEQKKYYVQFTLKVKDYKGPGHRLHTSYNFDGLYSQKRSSNACWHVHGDFFDCLFSIAPDAVVSSQGRNITKEEGNWSDWNIGSMMFPVMYSESCECDTQVRCKSRTVSQSNLSAECWLVQIQGLEYCKTCESKDTDECGGQEIRKTGKNEVGENVPIS